MTLHKTIQNLPAIKAREVIPVEKRKTQWVKTLVGITVGLIGLLTPKYLGYPWQVGVGIAGFGGFISSQQLITDYLKAIPQAIGAIVSALGGKRDG